MVEEPNSSKTWKTCQTTKNHVFFHYIHVFINDCWSCSWEKHSTSIDHEKNECLLSYPAYVETPLYVTPVYSIANKYTFKMLTWNEIRSLWVVIIPARRRSHPIAKITSPAHQVRKDGSLKKAKNLLANWCPCWYIESEI